MHGSVPAELWNRLGTKVLPKLRSGSDVTVEVSLSATVEQARASALATDLRQILEDLGLSDRMNVDDEG